MAQDELITGAVSGVSFNTLTIDMPVYLLYLLRKFQEGGGKSVRAAIHHIAQLAEGTYSEGVVPKAIVICAGLGARLLGGVEDKDVYPVRGQTVILRAPWVRRGLTISNLETGLWTYIIPRRSGGVIVGGTKAENDWLVFRLLANGPLLSPSLIYYITGSQSHDQKRPLIYLLEGLHYVLSSLLHTKKDNQNFQQ